MQWLCGFVLFLVSIGGIATGELFRFDLTSLRPGELCGPSGVRRQPDLKGNSFTITEFCPIQNHINLFGTDQTEFLKRIKLIRRVSPDRPVSLFLLMRPTLADASILGPIGKQIVQFTISYNSQGQMTPQFPAMDLINLFDLRFWNCLYPMQIHKGDFSGMKNIRAIEFKASKLEFVEEGTFTNLPTLQTLAMGNDIRSEDKLYKQLKCDTKNAWLWEFLKGNSSLLQKRPAGDIFKLGNFTSTAMEVDQPDVKCK